MDGAESLIRTVVDAGVEICFANPGTTEMELVKAMDAVPGMRPVLALFEGVCTGAADGYARMADRPAMTLLHLGPGLGNGIANLHNAKRARTPLVNVIGEHSSWHLPHDPPLASDIESLARPVSGWVRRSRSGKELAGDGAAAVAAARSPPGQVATLIVPWQCCWEASGGPADPLPVASAQPVGEDSLNGALAALRDGSSAALFLGAYGCRERGLRAAERISNATGCRIIHETFVQRLERGAGIPAAERLPYFPDDALKALAGIKTLILAGSRPPVAFFGYPGFPSILLPEGCAPQVLARPEEDVIGALETLADELGGTSARGEGSRVSDPASLSAAKPGRPAAREKFKGSGPLTPQGVGAAVRALLPEGAIISDEALSPGPAIQEELFTAPPHTVLYLTGGAIGQGLPAATGAALACPDRQVLALESDGCAAYTLQALWTQAREGLDVTNVILSNRAYQILQLELTRSGTSERGPKTEALTDLGHPEIDWSLIARGMGVPATRADTAEAFYRDLERALEEPGPHLIEAIL